jgi:hypothetical protein
MLKVNEQYQKLCETPGDINEHLPTLYYYATQCETIFETGVRDGRSTWALTYGLLNNNKPQKELLLNDIEECNISLLLNATENTDLKIDYVWENNLNLNLDKQFDMLFIDTWHVYGQLKRELNNFSKYIKKYIILHDTTIDEWLSEQTRYGWWNIQQIVEQTNYTPEEIIKGLWPAITEFLDSNKNDWKLHARYYNNNGLTILKRITNT